MTTEEKICTNKEAFDMYDRLMSEIIHYQFSILDNEKFENYEMCDIINKKILTLIHLRALQISGMINVDKSELEELFIINKYELLNTIKNEEL
jgi:hypothetical protein